MLALDPFASINGDSINYIPVMWFFVAELGALLFVRYSNMRKTGSSTLCQGCWLRSAKKGTRSERSRADPSRDDRRGAHWGTLSLHVILSMLLVRIPVPWKNGTDDRGIWEPVC